MIYVSIFYIKSYIKNSKARKRLIFFVAFHFFIEIILN